MDEEELSFEKPCSPVDDVRCYWSSLLLTFLPIFLPFIGTFGNILNLALLSRKTFREKPVFLLLFLSVFDFLVLSTTIPWRFLGMFYDINYYDMSPIFCKINAWLSISSGSASLWVMAIVSIDRSVVVLSHTQRNVRQNRNKNLAFLFCGVSIVLALSGAMALYGHTDEETSDVLERNMTSVTQNCYYVSAQFESQVPLMVTIAVVFELIIPALAVVIGNFILLTYFCKRRRMFANGNNTDSQTKVLLLLTNFMLITVIPFGAANFFQAWLHRNDNFISPNLAIVKALAASLMLSNYSLNFLFFLLGGPMFRKEIKLMFIEVKTFLSQPTATGVTQRTNSSNCT